MKDQCWIVDDEEGLMSASYISRLLDIVRKKPRVDDGESDRAVEQQRRTV